MTSADRAEFRSHGLALRQELRGETVSYNGVAYSGKRRGSVSTGMAELTLVEGGQINANVLTWRIAKAILPATPLNQTLLTYQGESWKIIKVGGDEGWKDEWIVQAIQ